MSAYKLPIFDRKYFPWKLALILFFLSGGLLLAGRYYYFSQKKQIFTEQQNILEAIAKLKIRQIEQWHKDRLGDAMILRDNYFLIREISHFFNSEDNSAARVEINRWIKSFENKYDYYGYLIVDDKMRIRLTSSLSDSLKPDIIHRQLDEVIKDKKIIMTELHKDNNAGVVHMDLLIPLIDQESKEPRSFGAVILHIAPGEVLYPLIQSWPTASKSSETLIVRKEGDSVLFLNELRHRQHTALTLKYPLSSTDLLAVKALENYVGIVEGVDYRGIPVLGYISGIPGLPWHMIAKVDKEEIMKPLKRYLYLTMFVATLLVLINAIIFIFWVWDQRMKLNMSNLQSEIERKALTSHYQYLFKYANDIIILTDSNFQIVEINEKGLKTYGYTREDIIGMDSALLEAPSRITETHQHRKILQESGADFFEATHIGKDGSELTVEISARVIEIDGIEFFQLIGRDITERKEAEKTLLENELLKSDLLEKLNEAQQMSQSGSWEWDIQNNRVWWSDETYRIFGVTRHTYNPGFMDNSEFIHPDDLNKYNRTFENAFKTGEDINTEFRLISKDGLHKILNAKAKIINKNGQVISISGSVMDITQLKRKEEEILRLNDELEDRVVQRTKQLEATNKELEAFSYSVSHDLRAPIRSIHSFTNILLEDYGHLLDEEGIRICRIISSSGTKMGELIDDLLNYSRIGRSSMNIIPLDMQSIVNSVFSEITSETEKKRITLTIGNLHRAAGDPKLIKLVLNNLISNAIKYSSKEAHPEIQIGSNEHNAIVEYYVKDNGVGFEMEYKNKLFGVFQRLHSEKEFEGNGVGLAIVLRIISNHGGTVRGEGEPGKGAVFYFSLPVATDPILINMNAPQINTGAEENRYN